MEMLAAATPPPPTPPLPPPPPHDALGGGGGSNGQPKRKKGAKGKPRAATRFKWPNAMVAELLRLRYKDPATSAMIQSADTPTKKALAWQHVASVLSQSMGVVVRDNQVAQKYRKLKCIYQKEKRELLATGNGPRDAPIDEQLWEILNDAFGSRSGVNGDVLMDTDLQDENEQQDGEASESSTPAQPPPQNAGSRPPVVQLANALQTGMEAIASSLASRAGHDSPLQALTQVLQQQYEETRRFQALQLQILQQLLAQKEQEKGSDDM